MGAPAASRLFLTLPPPLTPAHCGTHTRRSASLSAHAHAHSMPARLSLPLPPSLSPVLHLSRKRMFRKRMVHLPTRVGARERGREGGRGNERRTGMIRAG
eukprot:scaffold49520_cov28-Tisochrysis_lutea.AAC.1